MNTKEKYITPELTVVSFKVEMGFNASTVNMAPGSSVSDPLGMSIFDENAQETWGWNTGGDDANTFGGSAFGGGWND